MIAAKSHPILAFVRLGEVSETKKTLDTDKGGLKYEKA
jgi:hypothetical protein